MTSNQKNISTSSKLEPNKQVQALLISKLQTDSKTPINIIVAKQSSTKSSSSSPSIIKMYPSNYNKTNVSKIIAVKNVKAEPVENLPSISASLVSKTENKFKNDTVDDDDVDDDDEDDDEEEDEDEDETSDQSTCELYNKPSSHLVYKKKQPINNMKRLPSDTQTVNSKRRKLHSSDCCSCCRETLEIIFNQQQEILNLLKETSKMSRTAVHIDKFDLLPVMPFQNLNDFLDFDESLSNENVQYQFTVKLRKLLVPTEQKSISNIMSAILSNELCKQISWIGVKSTIPFNTSNIVGLIIDLIQEYHNIDIDSVKSKIAEWLRRCGDRINNEIKRKQKKLEHTNVI